VFQLSGFQVGMVNLWPTAISNGVQSLPNHPSAAIRKPELQNTSKMISAGEI
jgi:hypothetical protein